MIILVISKSELAKIVNNALHAQYEICGLLLGRVEKPIFKVLETVFIRNIAVNKEEMFYMDPLEVYKVFMYAYKKNLEVIGIFHSHKASPYQSKVDLKYMRLWHIPWLIIDSTSGSYGAYIVNKEVEEVIINLI